jgi:hypothetical protein
VVEVSKEDDFDLIGNIDAAEPRFGIQVGKVVLRTHPSSACANDPACCVHNPSDHPLKNAPMNWRGDRGMMERICEHGIGHPDPDDIAHKRRTYGTKADAAWGVHGCDGCCSG